MLTKGRYWPAALLGLAGGTLVFLLAPHRSTFPPDEQIVMWIACIAAFILGGCAMVAYRNSQVRRPAEPIVQFDLRPRTGQVHELPRRRIPSRPSLMLVHSAPTNKREHELS